MKKAMIIITFLFAVVLSLTVLSGCGGTLTEVDDDYVPVSAIRVSEANIFLAPDGEVSSYQLSPEIYPANATNRKIYYYVEPEDLVYVNVSQSGLISAVSLTEKPVIVKIYTPDNAKAVAYVSVVVESVGVTDINFTETEINLVYGVDKTYPMVVSYTPTHGSDGRVVTFSSQNTDVVNIDKDTGMLTVVGVGTSTVLGRTTTLGGNTLVCRSTVRVKYYTSTGNFRLDVSTLNPQYNQVIGKPSTISFSIIRLNELCDPAPVIEWYEGGNRVLSQRGQWVFDYSPTITTPSTFNIKATVTCFGEQPIELFSPDITLRRGFSGFTVQTIEFDEHEKVYYGDRVEIDPQMANADDYKWYIAEKGSLKRRTYLGTSEADMNGGRFSFIGNYEGTQIVTAEGYVGDTNIATKTYTYEFIRYTSGDWYQVQPVTEASEKSPESYDWFLYSYDKATGKTVGSATRVGASMENDVFSYKTSAPGTYVLYASPVIGGVSVADEGLFAYSSPFTVFANNYITKTSITDVRIDAKNVGGEPELFVRWNTVGDSNAFVVEVVSDGEVTIFDGTANANKDLFGDYALYLPKSVATLDSDVTVRVKKKGGIYSKEASFTGGSIDSTYYPYLDELALDMNYYIESLEELGEFLNYLFIFRPASLYKGREILSDRKSYEKFSFKIHNTFSYENLDGTVYPTANTSTYSDTYQLNMFKLLDAASLAYCDGITYSYAIKHNVSDDSYDISLYLTPLPTEYKTTENAEDKITAFELHYSSAFGLAKRDENFSDFGVSLKKAVGNVTTTKQLYYVLSLGKRPVPVAGSVAERVYNEMKDVLREIIGDNMSDDQKVNAIYDYLVAEITYDKALSELGNSAAPPADLYDYAGFNLDGVFLYKSAVCDGISKAFVSLCRIEGIVCETVKGRVNGTGHIWNKVLLSGVWHNVDATWGRKTVSGKSCITYRYYLVNDAAVSDRVVYGAHKTAAGNYMYYSADGTDIAADNMLSDALDRLKTAVTEDRPLVGVEFYFNQSYRGNATAEDYLSDYIVDNHVFDAGDYSLYGLDDNGDDRVIVLIVKNAE